MRLAIDIGNSATKYALEGETGALQVGVLEGLDQLDILITDNVESVAVASVVPKEGDAIRAALEARQVRFAFLSAQNAPGLGIRYATPETVGADRLANALYLASSGSLPAIAVDFGTASKLDVVDAHGDYLGGAILPGPEMMVRALASGTAQLPVIELALPERAIGRSTVECLQSGTVLALAKASDGLIEAFEMELGSPARVVATGGAAGLLAPATVRARRQDPHVTLKGLLIASRRWHRED